MYTRPSILDFQVKVRVKVTTYTRTQVFWLFLLKYSYLYLSSLKTSFTRTWKASISQVSKEALKYKDNFIKNGKNPYFLKY